MKSRLIFVLEFPLLWDLNREAREGASDGRVKPSQFLLEVFTDVEIRNHLEKKKKSEYFSEQRCVC